MSKIKINILKDSVNIESFKYSNLNLLRIVMAGHNKPVNRSKRVNG
jgi:hypothetical protein